MYIVRTGQVPYGIHFFVNNFLQEDFMIETIYKLDNNENKKPDINIRLPKNIRQIGQNSRNMDCQIYIEENVLAFIKQEPCKDAQIKYGVLLGDVKQGNGYTYIFINGMIEVDDVIEDCIIFSDEVWTGIYDNIRRYYKEALIVGWYASFDHDISRDMLNIRKLHLDHFAGNNKVYLNINREDDDESFYVYAHNGLSKQPCYHVYFEKSVEFEDYIFGSGRGGDAMKEKENTQKEKGKYGIVLNNNMSSGTDKDSSKDGGIVDKLAKEGKRLKSGGLGRVASFATIVTLAGVLGVMWSNGGLDALGNKLKGIVNGFTSGSSNDKNNYNNIIDVDGVPKEEQTTESGSGNEDNKGEEDKTTENQDKENQDKENQDKENQDSEANATEGTTADKEDDSVKPSDEEQESSTEQESTSGVASNEEQTTEKTQATITDINKNYASYVVKDGETLYSIAMLFYGTSDMIDDIMALNKIEDENYVMEGQKILLP